MATSRDIGTSIFSTSANPSSPLETTSCGTTWTTWTRWRSHLRARSAASPVARRACSEPSIATRIVRIMAASAIRPAITAPCRQALRRPGARRPDRGWGGALAPPVSVAMSRFAV